jgi:hypothetical protein
MSETEAKQDPQAQKLWDDLSAEVNQNYSEEFKAMIHADEWQLNGDVYHFQFQNHKRLGELKKLEGEDIDEAKNWDLYTDNYRKRAKLLIQEMTDEKFDNMEFYPVENLVTAWSVRARRGFRKSKSGTNNDLPNGTQS